MEISSSVKKKIEEWEHGPYDQKTKEEISFLLKNNPHELIDSFCETLNFGTGGIRAKMGVGINRLNQYTISFATQGLANYITSLNIKNPKVLIGFDNRHNSKFFASVAARVLAKNNIKVFLFENLRPTPLISFGCRYKNCTAAINITASHNTKEYNGYKVFWSDGGQVLPPHDEEIIQHYSKIESINDVKISKEDDFTNIEIIDSEIDIAYLEKLFSMELYKKEKSNGLKIIYSPLHGSGITIIPKCLNEGGFKNVIIVKEQETIDPDFTNAKKPNPEEKETLKFGIASLLKNNGDIFIATDPDADRVGVVININNSPYIFTGNEMAAIMLDYICRNETLSKNSACVKSIVTTKLLNEIAKSYDIRCFEVLTGFKYIAEKISIWESDKSLKFIFGSEESLGYLYETFVRDKDAVASSLLIAKIASEAKKNKKNLLNVLYEIYKKNGLFREALYSFQFEASEAGLEKMNDKVEKIRSHPLKIIANFEVVKIEDFLKGKIYNILENTKSILDLPFSNVLRYTLSDKTTITIRPSGTEPKIKVYISVETHDIKNIEEDIKKLDEKLKSFYGIILDILN
ncbi:MAG: hypothetical protein A2888_00065 [Chlamydiae bacterium RIFCSPLOWO2_01_FULL_28_7]|nr:MAG: hypothetical protein A2888_00065 [Chlamydiae bacterium RIFCSPLOWO2_01_FULL_28_7]